MMKSNAGVYFVLAITAFQGSTLLMISAASDTLRGWAFISTFLFLLGGIFLILAMDNLGLDKE